MTKRKTLANRLTWIVLLPFIVAITLVLGVMIPLSSHYIENNATQRAKYELTRTTQQVQTLVDAAMVATNNVAPIAQMVLTRGTSDTSNIYNLMRQIVLDNPFILGCNISVEPGYLKDRKTFAPYFCVFPNKTIDVWDLQDFYDYDTALWYRQAKEQGSSIWTEPYYGPSTKQNIATNYSIPLYDGDLFIGSFNIDLKTSWINDVLLSTRSFPNSYVIMASKEGRIIVHPDSNKVVVSTLQNIANDEKDQQLLDFAQKLATDTALSEGSFLSNPDNESKRYYYYDRIPETNWVVMLVIPNKDLYGNTIYIYCIISLLFLLLAIVIVRILQRTIRRTTAPIEEIASSARSLAQGNFDTPLPNVRTNDEARDLCESFDVMRKAIKQRKQDLAVSIAERESIATELNVARNIQLEIVPDANGGDNCHWNVATYLKPTEAVGGDMYDYFKVSDTRVNILVGDVCGHGIPAALIMSRIMSAARIGADTITDPSHMMEIINRTLSANNTSSIFCTLFLASIDLTTGCMYYSNAGHHAPLLFCADGTEKKVEVDPNVPIGLDSDIEFTLQRTMLPPGSLLMLYTDGITEAMNHNNEEFSATRLRDVVTKSIDNESTIILNNVMEAVFKHSDGEPQRDDFTMLAFRFMAPISTPADKDKIESFHLTINNNFSDLQEMYNFIDGIVVKHRIPLEQQQYLRLVLEEAVVNVINYAYPSGGRHNISMDFTEEHDGNKRIACFVLTDDGIAFDPTKGGNVDIEAPLEERNVGGLGIFLIKQIMEVVEYRRENNRNILTMKCIIKD